MRHFTVNTQHARASGFTLIELLMVVVIVAILLVVALPAFIGTIRDNRVRTAANTLQNVLTLARTEALARGATVVACATATPDNVTPACAADGAVWGTGGWVVYATGTTNTLIKSGTLSDDVEISGPPAVYFNAKGRSMDSATGTTPTAATMTAAPSTCSSGVNLSMSLTVETTGRVINTAGKCS